PDLRRAGTKPRPAGTGDAGPGPAGVPCRCLRGTPHGLPAGRWVSPAPIPWRRGRVACHRPGGPGLVALLRSRDRGPPLPLAEARPLRPPLAPCPQRVVVRVAAAAAVERLAEDRVGGPVGLARPRDAARAGSGPRWDSLDSAGTAGGAARGRA